MNIVTLAIKRHGLTGLAAALGVTYQAVRKWERFGVPAERVLQFASAGEWAYTPHQLRPDIYPHPDDGLPEHLRGLAA